ncbi:hypothetical protein ZWY2020_035111 [Hordeum vulgare]|nr:hypothetical protein ZWY2020_035111 [Hordeum vulgare]
MHSRGRVGAEGRVEAPVDAAGAERVRGRRVVVAPGAAHGRSALEDDDGRVALAQQLPRRHEAGRPRADHGYTRPRYCGATWREDVGESTLDLLLEDGSVGGAALLAGGLEAEEDLLEVVHAGLGAVAKLLVAIGRRLGVGGRFAFGVGDFFN